jgi:hypothetical protein
MLFSERFKLSKDYEEWLKENPIIKDCALSVISFLSYKKLLKEEKENV